MKFGYYLLVNAVLACRVQLTSRVRELVLLFRGVVDLV
jgi:hypothetical protein